MKALWNAVAIVLLINALVLVGALVWLYADDRLSEERLRQAAIIFQTMLAQDAKASEAQKQLAEEQAVQAEETHWLEEVSKGPVSVAERLERDHKAEELGTLAQDRAGQDQHAWLESMEHYRQRIEQLEAKIRSQREELQQIIYQQAKQGQDEGFRQAVKMYQQAPPKLAKQMFMELIGREERSQVVEYLAAMQSRKAADVLKEFKTPAEVKIAADLIEGLRLRGIDLVKAAMDDTGGVH